MVFDFKVEMIVMLCSLTEGGRQKCAYYWNENLNTKFKIKVIEEKEYNKYLIIRKFNVTNSNDESILKFKRTISILLSLGSIVILFILIARLIIPELKSCIEVLVSGIPAFSNHIIDLIKENPHIQDLLPESVSTLNIDMVNWKEVIDNTLKWFTLGAGTVIEYVTSL